MATGRQRVNLLTADKICYMHALSCSARMPHHLYGLIRSFWNYDGWNLSLSNRWPNDEWR